MRGETSHYLIARLRRSNPDIADQLAEGEFKSVRQAAIAAGIVKVKTTFPLAPLRTMAYKALSPANRIGLALHSTRREDARMQIEEKMNLRLQKFVWTLVLTVGVGVAIGLGGQVGLSANIVIPAIILLVPYAFFRLGQHDVCVRQKASEERLRKMISSGTKA